MNSALYLKYLKEALESGFSQEVAERLAREGTGTKLPKVPRPRPKGMAPTESAGEFAGQFELPFDNIDSPMRAKSVDNDVFPDWDPKTRAQLEADNVPGELPDTGLQQSLPLQGNMMKKPSMLESLVGKGAELGSATLGQVKKHPIMAGVGGIGGILAAMGLSGDDEEAPIKQKPTALDAMFDNNDPVERLRARADLGPAVPGDRHLPSRGIKTASNPMAGYPKQQAQPKPMGSPMTEALRKPSMPSGPAPNGISSFAQGGVSQPSFGADSSGLDSLFKSIEQDTSKDPYSMGLPQQKQGGGFGDIMKQFGPVLAGLLFGRMMR